MSRYLEYMRSRAHNGYNIGFVRISVYADVGNNWTTLNKNHNIKMYQDNIQK